MRVGVIGLGNIGGAVAANLVADGHRVVVHDVDAARVQAAVEAGAVAGASPGEVARQSDVTFTSLPTPAVMEAVAAAWLEGAAPGAILVDLSTNAPATVRAVGARLAAAGRHLLEAPLTGGAPGARTRMLVFMVGGEPAVYQRVKALLDRLGRATFHVGALGLGNTAKLVNSLIAFAGAWLSLEALAIAAKAGVELRTMVEVVRAGGAGNYFTDRMVEGIDERGRPTQFALALAAKDAGLLLDVARATGVPVPAATEVANALAAAVAAGLGERDFTDLVELIERQAGLTLRLGPPRG
ncbi:MAG TPA: NAD(P)-dependent oxidoreductase [Candidatus Binatia bacterium]|nr:NAD(P)-dependent oxidoreductase [Candidatus Binatia bacterium]